MTTHNKVIKVSDFTVITANENKPEEEPKPDAVAEPEIQDEMLTPEEQYIKIIQDMGFCKKKGKTGMDLVETFQLKDLL